MYMKDNKKNYDTNKREIKIPTIVFYVFVGAFLVIGVIAIVVLLIFFFLENKNFNTKELHTIAIGIAGSLFSAGILLNAVGTYLFNERSRRAKEKETKLGAVIEAIKEFNYSTTPLYRFTKNVQVEVRGSLKKARLKVEPSLEIQEEAIKKFESEFENEDEYQNLLIKKTILFLTIEPNVVSNSFSEHISKVYNGEKGYKLDKNTIGCSQVLRIYHERRIKVLNFFESLAIQYMNNLLDRELVDAQFKDIIIEVVKLFYYDIYKKEGNVSYPSLLMLCEHYKK